MNDALDTRLMVIRNDELLPAHSPVVSITDPAMIQGHGLFETIQAYEGRPFALSEHLDRLESGCETLGLNPPPREKVETSFQELMKVNELLPVATCRLRLTIAGGREAQIEVYEATPSPHHPETAQVITGPLIRNERSVLNGIKTLSYGENAVATRMTKEQGATEALWSNTREDLCEGTWSNVFVRISGKWKTPPLESGCLPGVTRSLVLHLAREHGLEIEEESIPIHNLSAVESAFLTSAIREIQPVTRIDEKELSSHIDSDILALMQAYKACVEASLKKS
ncbi:MAG: aminotransferase class IV [Verrucomicrobiota bacterium]